MNLGAVFQFLYSHEAATTLPASNVEAIIITGINAEEKISAKPIIL